MTISIQKRSLFVEGVGPYSADVLTRDDYSAYHWYLRPEAREWRGPKPPREPELFHQSFPGYRHTPLIEVPDLAKELQVAHVLIKDESTRLDLPAFKILGASWAVYRAVTRKAGVEIPPRLSDLQELAHRILPCTLVTATDGNHGRALARMARHLGLAARIFAPDSVPMTAIELIEEEGANVIVLADDYDATVRTAAEYASRDPQSILVQDTAWEGYDEVPRWIVDGYSTMFREVETQLSQRNLPFPDLVAVPTGVGSLLQSATAFYRSGRQPAPSLLAVEPTTANCVTASLRRQRPVSVRTSATAMAGLNCGTPSTIAWPVLRAGVDAAVCVDDEQAAFASTSLAERGISSGACGAAALAGIRQALLTGNASQRYAALGLTEASTVVLLNTEGRSPDQMSDHEDGATRGEPGASSR